MRRFLLLTALVLLLGVFALGLIGVQGWATLKQPLAIQQPATLMVNSGDSVSTIARKLERDGTLASAWWFRVYARVMKKTQIKVGEYRIATDENALHLLDRLIAGDIIHYQATLVEGWTFQQALRHIQGLEKIRIELGDKSSLDTFLTSLNLPNNHPEGWFFPDTYQYSANNSDREVLANAHQRMLDTLATEWAGRDVGLPYENSYQALIMASIVEKETGAASERQQIAGVFIRRLQHNMRLQTDPTVIYGLGENFDGNLRRRDLNTETAYNTYLIRGLPPTPIALPGREAIFAAMHPDNSNNLYFVARGDGSHQFSETLEQHNQAVQTYQVKRRSQQYRSTPEANNNLIQSNPQEQQ